jgi:hypothetical protein
MRLEWRGKRCEGAVPIWEKYGTEGLKSGNEWYEQQVEETKLLAVG